MVIPFTKFFNQKRLVIFFHLSDIDRNKKLSGDDLRKFLEIQFQHRNQDMNKFTDNVVNKFESLFEEEVNFEDFLAEISKV